MPEPNIEIKLDELKARHAQELKKLQDELELKHSQDIQRMILAYKDREEKLLSENKVGHQAKTRELVISLLRTKSERDKILLAVSWTAIAALVVIAVTGLTSGVFSKFFMLAALAGFMGVIIFARKNLMNNSKHLKLAMEGTVLTDPVLEEDDGRPLRFLVFGFISALLLGLALYMNYDQKDAVNAQTTGPSDNSSVPVEAKAADTTKSQSVLVSATVALPGPSNTPTAVNTAGNGGNFTGGSSHAGG